MYVIKPIPGGETLPMANRDSDGIDFAVSLAGYHVTKVTDLAPVYAWRAATHQVELTPAHPDPEDEARTIPATYAEEPVGNTLDLDIETGEVLLKDAAGAVIQRLAGQLIQ